MILTGTEIIRQVREGRIVIEPFREEAVGPNSVDVRLGPRIATYSRVVLDSRNPCDLDFYDIPEGGVLLHPGVIYLGETVEFTHTPYHVPEITGRSSTGRLGCGVHVTAGRGDVGFRGKWTLEMWVVQPLRVYAGMEMAQLSFFVPVGPLTQYAGRYQDQDGPTASRMHLPRPERGAA